MNERNLKHELAELVRQLYGNISPAVGQYRQWSFTNAVKRHRIRTHGIDLVALQDRRITRRSKNPNFRLVFILQTLLRLIRKNRNGPIWKVADTEHNRIHFDWLFKQ